MSVPPRRWRDKVKLFITKEMCWPYTAAFVLTLIIYLADATGLSATAPWPSIAAFSILFAYYLKNAIDLRLKRLQSHDPPFFLKCLSILIFVWAGTLLALIFLSPQIQDTL